MADGNERLDLEHRVTVTLQEAYCGTTRLVELAAGGRFTVQIPPGVATGTKVRFAGYGKRGQGHGSRGDLYLVIEVAPHPGFQRQGADLSHRLFVPVAQLAYGGIARVRTLDGRILNLSLPAGTKDGHQFRLAGEGMPSLSQAGKRGDLYVTVQVAVPEERLTFPEPRQRESVCKTCQQRGSYPVYPDFLIIPAKVVLWLLGLLACFLFVLAVSGQSVFWTILAMLIVSAAWVMLGLSKRGLFVPLCLIGLIVIPVVISLLT
jgi:DnaJ C terminal domain